MNKRIKKKKRKQREALLKLFDFATGSYEWSAKCSSSVIELSTAFQKLGDCTGHIDLYYFQ